MADDAAEKEEEPSILPRERMVVFAQATFAILIILLTLSLIDLARNDDLEVPMQAAKREIDKLPPPESAAESGPDRREIPFWGLSAVQRVLYMCERLWCACRTLLSPKEHSTASPEASGVITLEPGKVGEFNFNLVTHKACQNVKTLRLADKAVADVHRSCRGRVHAYAGPDINALNCRDIA